MGWLIELLPFSLVWSAGIHSFLVFSIRMRSGWCLPWMFFGMNLWGIYTNFQWTLQKHSRQWENACLDCVLPPERSASCLLLRNQKPREPERALLHPVTLCKMKTRSSSSFKRFFVVQFVKLCFLTSTGHYRIMFKSREAPSAPQTGNFCVLQGADVVPGAMWAVWKVLVASFLNSMVQEHWVHPWPSWSNRKSSETINNSKYSIKKIPLSNRKGVWGGWISRENAFY